MDDSQLLREYAGRRSEEAFATLVSRHIDLVYSTAVRQVGNHHAAEEITQTVFLLLARKARALDARTVVPVWLFRAARLTAANYLRAEIRRGRRELEAYMQSDQHNEPARLWQEVAPLLTYCSTQAIQQYAASCKAGQTKALAVYGFSTIIGNERQAELMGVSTSTFRIPAWASWLMRWSTRSEPERSTSMAIRG